MRRSGTVQDRIFIARNRSMSRMAKPMILSAMLPFFPSWMHMGQFSDDFPVNGECGKLRPDLFRNGLFSLHLRIDAQMGQCLEGIGTQGVSRVGPAVKKLNPGHGTGCVRNASVWEDSSSNK